jgi:hypothetical protein
VLGWGTITTAAGLTLAAVHIVSTDDGGRLSQSYVCVDEWIQANALPESLNVEPSKVFPFEYTLAVPAEDDRYQD